MTLSTNPTTHPADCRLCAVLGKGGEHVYTDPTMAQRRGDAARKWNAIYAEAKKGR
jgi:hypothetical protein